MISIMMELFHKKHIKNKFIANFVDNKMSQMITIKIKFVQ